jgi:hypothetical protein
MNRISPNVGRQDRFNDFRDIPASEFFTPASDINESGNYQQRQIAQLLACVAVEEDPSDD